MMHSDNEDKPSIITVVALFITIFVIGKMLTIDNGTKSPTGISSITNVSNSASDLDLTMLELPENGTTNYYTNADAIAPFSVYTEAGQNYFIKLVDADTNKTVVTVFVCGGESIRIKVPLGSYELRSASGFNWYGEDHLFGSNTSYSKADKIFTFYIDGQTIQGNTVELIDRINGNLHTSSIDKDKF